MLPFSFKYPTVWSGHFDAFVKKKTLSINSHKVYVLKGVR